MINNSNVEISKISIHSVGNKTNDDILRLSSKDMNIDSHLKDLLSKYFLCPFKHEEQYVFYHESDLKYNEVFGYISDIFDKKESFHEKSINLSKHLYEKSVHPKIKSGEFYVVYFEGCVVDGEIVDAVGLFKSENKDTFLKVYPMGDGFEIESQQGININKLDKGALVFNINKRDGYVVSIVDNTNKGNEALYWTEDFLHVRKRRDGYYNTQNVLSMCKHFVMKELPQQFDISKIDQIDLLNKSVQFFKERENFDIGEFTREVITQPEVIDSFNKYKIDYQQERDIDVADNFSISDKVVKKQAKSFKNVIKLDKNFHIYIYTNKELLEQGEDNKGKYYKVYYQNEY